MTLTKVIGTVGVTLCGSCAPDRSSVSWVFHPALVTSNSGHSRTILCSNLCYNVSQGKDLASFCSRNNRFRDMSTETMKEDEYLPSSLREVSERRVFLKAIPTWDHGLTGRHFTTFEPVLRLISSTAPSRNCHLASMQLPLAVKGHITFPQTFTITTIPRRNIR
ncbi:hypothetical protein IW262DRAFT_1388561, partial [Armillaria fumosa]